MVGYAATKTGRIEKLHTKKQLEFFDSFYIFPLYGTYAAIITNGKHQKNILECILNEARERNNDGRQQIRPTTFHFNCLWPFIFQRARERLTNNDSGQIEYELSQRVVQFN